MAVLNLRTCKCPTHGVRIDRASRHGNRFRIPVDGDRATVIALHAWDIAGKPEYLRSLDELAGQDVWCWCAPLPCHGDTLSMLANISFEERLAWAERMRSKPHPLQSTGRNPVSGPTRRALARARAI